MSTLETAIQIAASSHEGQVDKVVEPYILHPLRVMLAQTSAEARIVGVLHDVAEDDESGWQNIHEGNFTPAIIEAIDSVTRRGGEDYFNYIARAGSNPIGRSVKIADLNDNMAPSRAAPTDGDRWNRMKKYDRVLSYLLGRTVVRETA